MYRPSQSVVPKQFSFDLPPFGEDQCTYSDLKPIFYFFLHPSSTASEVPSRQEYREILQRRNDMCFGGQVREFMTQGASAEDTDEFIRASQKSYQV